MTRVCLVGETDSNLQYELLSRETAREALSSYELTEPFHNSVAVETVSLGAAVALLNDLDWYLVRFVEEALVLEPSVSEQEWLSRSLATSIREEQVDPAHGDRFLKLFGLVYDSPTGMTDGDDTADGERAEGVSGVEDTGDETRTGESGGQSTGVEHPPGDPDRTAGGGADDTADGPPRLVEPMFVARTGGGLPSYDLRDVEETLTVRVTEAEFER